MLPEELAMQQQHEQNHVLLIRLDEKMTNVITTLADMRVGIRGKAEVKDLEDFSERTDRRIEEITERTDKRIAAIESSFAGMQQKFWMIVGGLIVIDSLLRFVK